MKTQLDRTFGIHRKYSKRDVYIYSCQHLKNHRDIKVNNLIMKMKVLEKNEKNLTQTEQMQKNNLKNQGANERNRDKMNNFEGAMKSRACLLKR
jgi:hypothetical protein